MSREEVLDLRGIDRSQRFGMIISKLGELGEGDSLILFNDFEPLPLYGELKNRGYQYQTVAIAATEWRVTIKKA